MTKLGFDAKSYKLPQCKSLVLKSCEFIRSSWLMDDETFHSRFMAQICLAQMLPQLIYILYCNHM